jgi:hypothetical protein
MIWRKVLAIDVTVLAGLLFVAMMVFGYLAFLDGSVVGPVVTYETQVLPTDAKTYAPGDAVLARVQFLKHRDIVGEMKWNLVNHRVYPYASRVISIPHGVVDAWFPVEHLPTGCAEGEYHFEGIVSYRVNPLRVVSYQLRTDPFLIVPTKIH